jgi:hypothetical protein
VTEELAEGAAGSAVALGLDESAGLPEYGAGLDHGNGNGNGNGADRVHHGNGRSSASATSGGEAEVGASPEGA